MNGYETYRTAEVTLADPIKLVELLYRGAIESVSLARRCLASGDVMERGQAVSKAAAILMELTSSLDMGKGGGLAARLADLYCYMLRRLTEAHALQDDRALAEVQSLLEELGSAWAQISAAPADVPTELLRMDAERPAVYCSA